MKESNRQKKFSKVILQEMSEIFQREVQVPGNPMLTVTVVRATPDLGIARIYISVFPEAQSKDVETHLNEVNKEIRHLLARRIRKQVRHIPELEFFIDDTMAEVKHMDGLFDQIKLDKPTS